MTIPMRRTLTDVAVSTFMTLLPVAVIVGGLMIAATLRYGGIGNAVAAIRGETLVIRPETQSFGIGHPGQKITVEYSLTNLSSSPTRLLGSRTTCVCTVPERLPKTLSPRESHVIRVVLHIPDRVPTNPEEAQFRQEVLVYTSDPSHPLVTLTLVGEVREAPPSGTSDDGQARPL